jgi:hypothetical protein
VKLILTDPTSANLETEARGDASGMLVNQGEVKIVEVTAVADTSAYANGDVLTDTMTLTAALRAAGKGAILRSVEMLDEDDNAAYSFDLIFMKATQSLGTKNVAPAITDAQARDIIGFVRFATTDVIDLGGVKQYYRGDLAVPLIATSGVDVFVGVVINTGTPTQTASGLKFKFGIEQK